MAQKVKITTTKTTRRRKHKTGGNTGYKTCPRCHGKGRVKA